MSVFSANAMPARRARRLASTSFGFFLNLASIQVSVGSIGRWKSQDVMPRQKKLRQRNSSRADSPRPFSAVVVSFVMSTGKSCQRSSEPSSIGLRSYPALRRLASLNASRSTMRMPPGRRSSRFIRSAAGFMATRTSRSSPGVNTCSAAKWSWNALTPARVPAGARISAGKSGSVARSFPASADSAVNWDPVTCMPSPESPAKRMTTPRRDSTRLATPDEPSDISNLPEQVYRASRPGATRGGRRSEWSSEVQLGLVPEEPAVEIRLRRVLDDLGAVVGFDQVWTGRGESVVGQEYDAGI